MPVRGQDHRRIAMAVAAMLAGTVHELFDFTRRQILSKLYCLRWLAGWHRVLVLPLEITPGAE
jgi:hypothetical protein